MLGAMRHGALLGGRQPLAGRGAACLARGRRQLRVAAGRGGGRGFSELLELRKSAKRDKDGVLRPYKVSPPLAVPGHIARPPYVGTGEMPWDQQYQIHETEEERAKMRAACKLAARVLEYAGSLVKPGITTDFIDRKVHQMIIDHNAYPSPLTYGNFPKSVCTSVNECTCHGIPDARELREGDIVNIDVTVYLDGYHGDTSCMFYAGQPSAAARRLCELNREALALAIAQCGPGVPINAIGKTIHAFAEQHRLTIVPDFIGHGVGRAFHGSPMVHSTRNRERGSMRPHQTFTIEPIFCEGAAKTKTWKDGWTIVSADGSWSAQHEHTVLITESGREILTLV